RDSAVMRGMGKKQLLDRRFGFVSIVGLTTTMLASWETIGLILHGGVRNGGPVALVYGFVVCFLGSLATCCSIAELASKYPTAGGQYHFIALLAPPRWKNFLSYMAGWISILAWQATTASCALIAATAIQGLIVLNHPSYTLERWHGTLIFMLVILVSVLFNTILARVLPFIESCILVIHVLGWFCCVIPLIMFAPQSPPSFVFTTFLNTGGWASNALSAQIGMITLAYPFCCWDGATHMAEEIEDAARIVPWSMLTTVILNGALGLGFLLTILFGAGDISAALDSPTGYPILAIFLDATRSTGATTAMATVLVAMLIFSTIGVMAAASRLAWAFARDRGLPFADWLAAIHPRWRIPANTIAAGAIANLLLAAIHSVSRAAFDAIVSLAVVALYSTYFLPTVLILYLRVRRPRVLRFGPFKLGRWGIAVNVVSIVYMAWATVLLLFPTVAPVTAANMNWAPVVYVVTVLGALMCWWRVGLKDYHGPL
ncbi:amino acid transporter, partial [Trichodelitschia bisporula]